MKKTDWDTEFYDHDDHLETFLKRWDKRKGQDINQSIFSFLKPRTLNKTGLKKMAQSMLECDISEIIKLSKNEKAPLNQAIMARWILKAWGKADSNDIEKLFSLAYGKFNDTTMPQNLLNSANGTHKLVLPDFLDYDDEQVEKEQKELKLVDVDYIEKLAESEEGIIAPNDDGIIKANRGSQTRFVQCTHKQVLYDGTRGPGKTFALGLSFLTQVGKGFGEDHRGILFRRKYKELNYIRIELAILFRKLYGNQVKHKTKDDTFYFPSGETLRLAHAMYERDYENFHGQGQYTWVGFDELTSWATPYLYKKLQSICRTRNPKIKTMIRSATNSLGPGHSWVKEDFKIDSCPHGRPVDQGYGEKSVVIFGKITENPYLMSDKNYLRYLLTLVKSDSNLSLSWLKGSWNIVAGGALSDCWHASVHIIKPFKIPKQWTVYRCFDWGSASPFACLYLAKSDGTFPFHNSGDDNICIQNEDLFVIGEVYGWGGQANRGTKETPEEVKKRILAYEKQLKEKYNISQIKAGGADSAIYNHDRGNNEKSIADILKPVSFVPADKSSGSRIIGLELLRDKLKNSIKEKGDNYTTRDKAGIFFFDSTCIHTIRTLPTIPRDEKNPEDADTDSEDHCYDALRYFLHKKGSTSLLIKG